MEQEVSLKGPMQALVKTPSKGSIWDYTGSLSKEYYALFM